MNAWYMTECKPFEHEFYLFKHASKDKPALAVCNKCQAFISYSDKLQLDILKYTTSFSQKWLPSIISVVAITMSLFIAFFFRNCAG